MITGQTSTWCIRGSGTPTQWLFVRLLLGSQFSHRLYIDMPTDPASAPYYLGPEAVSAYSDWAGAPHTWLPTCQGQLIHGVWLRHANNARQAVGLGHYGASLAGVGFAQLAGAIASRAPQTDWQPYSLAAQLHRHGGQIQPSTDPRTIDSTLRPGASVCARQLTRRLVDECMAREARIGPPPEPVDLAIDLTGGNSSDAPSEQELEVHPNGVLKRRGSHTTHATGTFSTTVAAHSPATGWTLPLHELGDASLWFSSSDCAALLATAMREYGAARFDGAAWRSACCKRLNEVQADIMQVGVLLRAAAAKAADTPPQGPLEPALELLLRGRPDLPHLLQYDLSPLTILALTLAGPPCHPDPIAASLAPDLVAHQLAKVAEAVRQRLTTCESFRNVSNDQLGEES